MIRMTAGWCWILFFALAGCGGVDTNSTPGALTPEQQRQMDAAQEKANDQERARAP